ncbi:MAG: hypothetical protein IKE03_06690 [Blautia sp.]|nr:hypothetical protein [Blautia sp.]
MSRIFREKALKEISRPEELSDYIRVTRPSVWILLAAVILLLAGMIAWMAFGTVELHQPDGSIKQEHPIIFVTN